jgi:hypothetical protein
MEKVEKGSLVKWENSEKKQIVWMVVDDGQRGVVIHSDGLVNLGTLNYLNTFTDLSPFVGTVHVESKSKETA